MRTIGRMVGIAAASVALVASGAVVAQAQDGPHHTYTCATQDECESARLTYRHYHYPVSEVWYRDPDSTCAPEWPCAPGWQFQWAEY
ncbi:hypothetical protein ACIA49_19945 [Kribbella sp. NPDC051587]|uniref:hypothetical protein n=1 Tax=Kribbella sp. NPDC051587 TaxID=3364119 RepID=UPI0037A98D1F